MKKKKTNILNAHVIHKMVLLKLYTELDLTLKSTWKITMLCDFLIKLKKTVIT